MDETLRHLDSWYPTDDDARKAIASDDAEYPHLTTQQAREENRTHRMNLARLIEARDPRSPRERRQAASRAAISAIAAHHALRTEDAEHVVDALGLDADDVAYLGEHPQHLARWTDDTTQGRLAGATGWVAWFEPSETAISVTNGDPIHHKEIPDLDTALAEAQGDDGSVGWSEDMYVPC